MAKHEQSTARLERVGDGNILDVGSIAVGAVDIDGVHPTYTRLNDREQRTGQGFFRKRAYLKQLAGQDTVVLQFHPNYQKMMGKYLQAYSVLPADLVGRTIAQDDQNHLLEIEYLGAQLSTDADSISQAAKVLRKVNSHGRHTAQYRPVRYLPDLRSREQSELAPLHAFVDALPLRAPGVTVGYGIEDPVVSNFTNRNGQTFLVDLDNFGSDYAADTMVGFMVADAAYAQSNLDVTPTQAIYAAIELGNDPVDPLTYLSGYMGKIAVAVIDNPDAGSTIRQKSIAMMNEFADAAYQLLPQ